MGKEQAGISKMAGLGTIVNVAGILAGCGVGLLLKGGLPKRLQDTISSAVGLCVDLAGSSMVQFNPYIRNNISKN